MVNVNAAGRAEKELGVAIQVIKKTSKEYALENEPPPCPSVRVNAQLIAEDDMVTFEELKAAIEGESDVR